MAAAMTDTGMSRDGLAMATPVNHDPCAPLAKLESPEDTAAFRRARTRFPVELAFFLISLLLEAFNFGAHWKLAGEINVLANEAATLTLPSNISALVDEYKAYPNNENLCDVVYFSNKGFSFIQTNLNSLLQATLAFFYIGVFFGLLYALYRLGHLRHLHAQRNKVIYETWHPVMDPALYRSRKALPLRDPTEEIAGQIRRYERLKLRGESSGYITLQLFHEIPLIMIFFIFITFVERYRGLNCAICVAGGQAICQVPPYIGLTNDYYLQVSMAACFLYITWNYATMTWKWVYYFQTFIPPWQVWKQLLCWFLSTLIFVSSFVAPIAILFAVYVGPFYYGFQRLESPIVLSAIFGALWVVGFLVFLVIAGLSWGESILNGLCCCDFCQVFWFAVPCVDACGVCCAYCDACDQCGVLFS